MEKKLGIGSSALKLVKSYIIQGIYMFYYLKIVNITYCFAKMFVGVNLAYDELLTLYVLTMEYFGPRLGIGGWGFYILHVNSHSVLVIVSKV